MSAKNQDNKNRWRNITVGFRASPEEAYKIDMLAKTSSMTKQDFILHRLLNEDIVIRPNIRIQFFLEKYLDEIAVELKRLEKINQDSDILENIAYLVKFISKLSPEQKEN